MVEVIKENNGIVIGNANREAWDICTNVINDSNRKHNIITISGESGGGRTYLLKSLKRNLSLEWLTEKEME